MITKFSHRKKKLEENSDTSCLVCDKKFSDDIKGKLRVTCLGCLCTLCIHNNCAQTETENYVYNFYRYVT